jgi:drug/metabolite transporter (DMT)-like permease
VIGLGIGFLGVLWLAWDHAHLTELILLHWSGESATTGAPLDMLAFLAPIAACLAAALMYGFSANFTRRHLAGVAPMALATGSQLGSVLVLALPAASHWPAHNPGSTPWAAALALALVCTGVAYILYFRLISRVGPTYAMSVTYLVPAFAAFWGWVVLGEAITPAMLVGCAVILLGTALTTGVLAPTAKPAVAA